METAMSTHPAQGSEQPIAGERSSFAVIFVVAFAGLLAIALVAQLMGVGWRSWLPGAESAKSVAGGVKAAVYTFMSHLN
jgi:light-harvesting complex 1 beta chain